MSARDPSRTHRWLAALLAGLLALAPFLHSHIGISHESGFHIDGLHAVHHPGHDAQVSLQAPDDESPALGVAPVRPLPEDGNALWWPMALLLVLPLLCLLRPSPASAPQVRASGRTWCRMGLPPPSLAPPLR